MEKKGFSVEKVIYVYNDATGEKVYVGPDGDALGFVEIRGYFEDQISNRLSMPKEQALLMAKAIISLYGDYFDNDIYRHYKGETYRYISDATLEWCADDPDSHVIIYESKGGQRWVRPRSEFFGYVATPDGAVRRFEKIDRDDTCCGGFMDLFGVHRPGCDGDRE